MIWSIRLSPPAKGRRVTTTSILRSAVLTVRRPVEGPPPGGSAAHAATARERSAGDSGAGDLARNSVPSMRKKSDIVDSRISICTSDALRATASARIFCSAAAASAGGRGTEAAAGV